MGTKKTAKAIVILNVFLLVVTCFVPLTLGLKEKRNILPPGNVPLMTGSTQDGTAMENQIVGTIPLLPTLKLGLMSAITTLFLPGLHFTLTIITMVFALIGVASFICSSYDCRNILRGTGVDDFSPPMGFSTHVPKSRHPMYHNKNIGARPWETVPSIFNSLENSYTKYKGE